MAVPLRLLPTSLAVSLSEFPNHDSSNAMDAIYDSTQQKHDPKFFLQNGIVKPSPESPQRAEVFLKALHGAGHNIIAPEAHDSAAIQAIHTPDYLQFLETIHERWQHTGGSEEVIPNVHPNRWVANGYPDSAAGHAGWHMADTACPIGAGTWEAAQAGAKTVIDAAQRALNGATAVYALCRPPGHHAFADMAGGFCYLNNSALAAQELRSQHERVAILDVDVHHGNGTQGIFYRRRDVLTVSLHADPQRFYPFFWGYAHERGAGEGFGCNFNLPLPRHTADDEFLVELERGLERVRAFRPGALVVALGLDAFEGDPLAGLGITTQGFARIAQAIAQLKLPTVLVQEGGYLCDALGPNLVSFLSGFASR